MTRLTLVQAQQIVAGALAHSAVCGFRPMAIVVLDEAGHLKAAAREDDASMFRVDVATAKAWASVALGASSRALMHRAVDDPNFFVSLASVADGKFVAQSGAVLIKSPSGEVLGGVGASGGTGAEDEAICIAGVLAAGLAHG